jgi:hypothetical protein
MGMSMNPLELASLRIRDLEAVPAKDEEQERIKNIIVRVFDNILFEVNEALAKLG